MRTRVKGMVSYTSFMACRHSKVETAFYLDCNYFFCKEAWNKLVLACILCKKNCKNTLEQPCSNL